MNDGEPFYAGLGFDMLNFNPTAKAAATLFLRSARIERLRPIPLEPGAGSE